MKNIVWVAVIIVALIPVVLPSDIENEEKEVDVPVASARVWRDEVSDPIIDRLNAEIEREENESTERPRSGGKRRRRLRKRPRTTTPNYEEGEGTYEREEEQASQHQREEEAERAEDDNTQGTKRRPAKRRRRPNKQPKENEKVALSDDEEDKSTQRKRGRTNEGKTEEAAAIEGEISHQQSHTPDNNLRRKRPYEERDEEGHETTTKQPRRRRKGGRKRPRTTTIPPPITTLHDANEEETPRRGSVERHPTQEQETTTTADDQTFDRKNLFPTQRPTKKLPETSATLRKRLKPKYQHNSLEATTGKHDQQTITQLSNENKEGATEATTFRLLHYHKTTTTPTPPTTINNALETPTTEEPNYPKIPEEFYKLKMLKEIISELTSTTEKPQTTRSRGNIKHDMKEKAHDESTLETVDITNLKDDIVDLLKTNTGTNRLATILESRNMTLAQLIEHRERGSSQHHLTDIFKRTKSPPEHNTLSTYIQFPNEQVLGSFPKFLNDEIHQKAREQREMSPEAREPRLFDSLPEFTTKTQTANDAPRWRVIPNPRLKPVSVHGNYEEIQLTKTPNLSPDNNYLEESSFGKDGPPPYVKQRMRELPPREPNRPDYIDFRKIPPAVKSAILISGVIVVMAVFGFLSVLISCKVKQKRARILAKQDILCQHLQNDDFMNSQRSLSPVLTKSQHQGPPVFKNPGIHSNTTSHRHYYLWRTLRKTFQYD